MWLNSCLVREVWFKCLLCFEWGLTCHLPLLLLRLNSLSVGHGASTLTSHYQNKEVAYLCAISDVVKVSSLAGVSLDSFLEWCAKKMMEGEERGSCCGAVWAKEDTAAERWKGREG